MGRQAYRMDKRFCWEGTWWGYLLDPIVCKSCGGSGKYQDGYCPTCEGGGKCHPKVDPPGHKVDDLPNWWGDYQEKEYGWQMWEDVSDGSPMSPVFETPEELAKWLADSKASASGRMTASYEQWLRTILRGSAISMVMQGGVIRSGVEGFDDLGGD